MTLLLDTRDVDPEARRDALHDAFVQAGVPREIDLLSEQAANETRIEAWMFGSLRLLSSETPGLRVIRDSPSGQLDPMIALCVQIAARGSRLSATCIG